MLFSATPSLRDANGERGGDSQQVSISHFHIPPTDCPYNADIYFVTISRVLFGETKDWSWEMAAGACVALGGFGVYSFAKLKAMARKG